MTKHIKKKQSPNWPKWAQSGHPVRPFPTLSNSISENVRLPQPDQLIGKNIHSRFLKKVFLYNYLSMYFFSSSHNDNAYLVIAAALQCINS
jgi:hypothetical protein